MWQRVEQGICIVGLVAEPQPGPLVEVPLPQHHHHLHIYNAKTEGECKTQPHIRLPVNRQQYMAMVHAAALKARSTEWTSESGEDVVELTEGCLYFFLDAYKHENQTVWEKCFAMEDRKLKKSKSVVYITYEESSLLRRRQRHHPSVQCDVVEHMGIISAEPLSLLPRKRISVENSSNQMNHIGLVVTEDSHYISFQPFVHPGSGNRCMLFC